jgi:nitrogen regulatory protein PII
MKMILAIVRPDRLDSIQAALDDLGISGMLVTEGYGLDSQEGFIERYRGFKCSIKMPRKLRVEIAVSNDQSSDDAINASGRQPTQDPLAMGKYLYMH